MTQPRIAKDMPKHIRKLIPQVWPAAIVAVLQSIVMIDAAITGHWTCASAAFCATGFATLFVLQKLKDGARTE